MSGRTDRLAVINGPIFIDLFCGCGGFTLGMQQAGFRCLAAIDSNTEAISVFRANFPRVPHILHKDLTRFRPEQLAVLLGNTRVDVIVGGPPCQGFSVVRQVDAANHGPRVRRDKRRYYYRDFLRYVDFFQPRLFVMENVPGMRSAAKGRFFTCVQADARRLGYRIQSQIEEAWQLGVPQKRRRQLIIGVHSDYAGYFPSRLQPANGKSRSKEPPTLWDAIGDLPRVTAGFGKEKRPYNLRQRVRFLSKRGKRAKEFLNDVIQINRAVELTSHIARPHSARDLRDFARLREGEHSAEAIRRGARMEFPYDRKTFKDRYQRQHREELCSTIVAHLSKDGLMFIHPTQNRSLTPREAARVQTFPDWFVFPVPRTHQFRLIGNAVPPRVARAVGREVKKFLAATIVPVIPSPKLKRNGVGLRGSGPELPSDNREAREQLLLLVRSTRRELYQVKPVTFRRSWHALLFLYPELHPDNALDHGKQRTNDVPAAPEVYEWRQRYVRSGWPVALELIGLEAWRRYKSGELSERNFYCVAAQTAGMQHRRGTDSSSSACFRSQ